MADYSYIVLCATNVNSAETTFSTTSLGDADANRYIVLTISTRSAVSLVSATVGGVTATILGEVTDASADTFAALAIAHVPTGTTGDVVITFNATAARLGVGIYRCVGINPTPHDFTDDINTDPVSATVDVPNDGVIIGVAAARPQALSTTWSGITEDYNHSAEAYTGTGAHAEFASATSQAVSCTFTSGLDTVGMFASWGPAAGGGDVTDPTIDTLSPADNATGVAVDANLVITFSESVDAETGNIVIKKTSDDSTVETIDVTSGQVTGSGTATITINPSVTLANETEYYVQIDATAFDDAAGNSFAGIADTTTWSFTTVAAGTTTRRYSLSLTGVG